MKKITVIGSGVGGLSVAIRLASRGYNVRLYESNESLGGKIGQTKLGGYRFDTGPSLFTQPKLIEELIRICNKNPEEYFNYQKLEESCRYFFEDKTVIRGYSDPILLSKEIENKTKVSSLKVQKHLKKSAFLYNATFRLFLEKSLHKIKSYLNINTIISVLKLPFLDLFISMSKRNNKRFKNAKVEQIFNRYSTYNGSNPYKAPAILNLIPHIEINQGAYFPDKGMRSIAELLIQLCDEMGVKVFTNTKVERIEVKDGCVTGIHTENMFYESDIVICNIDVFFVYDKLLNIKQKANKIKKIERSTSAIIFYWGIKKTFERLDLHNIFFSHDYKQEFNEITDLKKVPDDPTIYVNITSKKQKSDAPENCENWFVMINTPANHGQAWEEIISISRENILKKLERVLDDSITPFIEYESILDPRSIESKTGSFQGALYGTSSNNRQSAFFRHPNFSNKIKGLYFCGGSVHPGGGIPLALSSAKIVDELIK